MNKKAFLACLTLMTPLVSHADGPIDGDLYGRISISLDNVDRDDTVGTVELLDEWQINSNASRFGYRGETALEGGMSIIYQVEWQVDVDGDSTDLTPRNRFLGLKGRLGTILAGRHDTPSKIIAKKMDIFNDLPGDVRNTFEGENREPNIAVYSTPRMGILSGHLAFIPGEDSAGGNDGLNDGISAVAEMALDNLYVALGIDRDVDEQDMERLVAQWTMGDLVFGAMYQHNENELNTIDESGIAASLAYTIGTNTFKVQVGQVDNDASTPVFNEEQSISFGFDRKLGSKTSFYSYITLEEDQAPGAGEEEITTIGAGVEHKF